MLAIHFGIVAEGGQKKNAWRLKRKKLGEKKGDLARFVVGGRVVTGKRVRAGLEGYLSTRGLLGKARNEGGKVHYEIGYVAVRKSLKKCTSVLSGGKNRSPAKEFG